MAARRSNRSGLAPSGRDVVNPVRLERDRRVDLCASCHGGQILGLPFSFVPGDPVKRVPVTARRTGNIRPGHWRSGQSRDRQPWAPGNGADEQPLFSGIVDDVRDVSQPSRGAARQSTSSDRCLTCHTVEACGRFAKDGRDDRRAVCRLSYARAAVPANTVH